MFDEIGGQMENCDSINELVLPTSSVSCYPLPRSVLRIICFEVTQLIVLWDSRFSKSFSAVIALPAKNPLCILLPSESSMNNSHVEVVLISGEFGMQNKIFNFILKK